MKKTMAILFALALVVGGASFTFAGGHHGGDHPGDQGHHEDCTNPDGCPGGGNGGCTGEDCNQGNHQDPPGHNGHHGSHHGDRDCPDDDGDGICNGQDPDWSGCTFGSSPVESLWRMLGLAGLLG